MSSRRYPLYAGDVPLPTPITITTSPPPYVSNILASHTIPLSTPIPSFPSGPASSYSINGDINDIRQLHNFPTQLYSTSPTFINSRQEVATSSSTGGAPPYFLPPTTTTTTSTMFTPPTVITTASVDTNDIELNLNGPNINTFSGFDGSMNNLSAAGFNSMLSSIQSPLPDPHTPYITPPTPVIPIAPPPPNVPVKVPLFFLHPVPNSNILTVMKCMQPVAQDILIDSREVSPFLPLLGCFFICTMEEREIQSIFPMSKPILRWGIYHKGTRNLLFSSFYRFNCAFGAKGYFTYPYVYCVVM